MEAISTLAIDPNGLYLMSGSHDGSLRIWNMEQKKCLQVSYSSKLLHNYQLKLSLLKKTRFDYMLDIFRKSQHIVKNLI